MATSTANTPLDNTFTKGLEGTTKWGTTNLTYFFATAADAAVVNPYIASTSASFGIVGATFNPLDTEPHRQAILDAFVAYEQVSSLRFTAAANLAAADLRLAGVDNYGGLNGSMDFPSASGISTFLFNTTAANLLLAAETGGANAVARVAKHELGHGLGLGHPHDTGNGTTSWTNVLPVAAGDDELDNERYTVMSYERGGLDVRNESAFGHSFTLSALDIAAIQHMYGANNATNNGNTSYALNDRGAAAADLNGADGTVGIGRGFFTIWDGGGSDQIRYDGNKSVIINLNDASLTTTDTADMTAMIRDIGKAEHYDQLPNEIQQDIENAEYHAGGFLSRIFDGRAIANMDLGGFTIANGVAIEDAVGDAKNDFLIGNELANLLFGFGGEDFLHGGAGNDGLFGGDGNDELQGGAGNDDIRGEAGIDTAIVSGKCEDYTLAKDAATGVVTIVHNAGPDGTDTLTGVEKVRFLDGTKDITGDVASLACTTDFIFLVDLSGSFFDDLPNFKASARDMAVTMLERDPNTRFALASFVDHPRSPFGSAGDYLYKAELPLTGSIDAFEAALAGLRTFDGGDLPEAQWVGLWRAAHGVGLNLRPDSGKIIMLATDASAHSASDYGLNESTIRAFLDNEGITVGGAPLAAGGTPADVAPGGDDIGTARGPGDNGNGVDPGLPTGGNELLESLLAGKLLTLGALPIFALTPGGTGYETVAAAAGGAVATLTSSGTNISDVLREALAKIDGVDTGAGTAGNDSLFGTPGVDTIFGGLGRDRVEGRESDDTIDGGGGDDTLLGEDGNDVLLGGSGQDTLVGGAGNDTLNGGIGIAPGFSTPVGQHDFMLGGTGNDTYHVDNTFDLVDEGAVFPTFAGSGTDVDTIISTADWFWDVYSVGERFVISEAAAGSAVGITIVASIFNNELVGNSGINIMFGRGGSDTYRAGDGIDFISLSLLGVNDANAYPGVDGPNTIVVQPRSSGPFSYDIVFEFESGKDKLNVASYGYTSAAEVMSRGVNDGLGNSYFVLGALTGVDGVRDGLDYLYMVGLTTSQLSAGDFIV